MSSCTNCWLFCLCQKQFIASLAACCVRRTRKKSSQQKDTKKRAYHCILPLALLLPTACFNQSTISIQCSLQLIASAGMQSLEEKKGCPFLVRSQLESLTETLMQSIINSMDESHSEMPYSPLGFYKQAHTSGKYKPVSFWLHIRYLKQKHKLLKTLSENSLMIISIYI